MCHFYRKKSIKYILLDNYPAKIILKKYIGIINRRFFMGKGLFGGMFDLNGDGDLDVFEQTLEFQAFSMLMEYSKKKRELKEAEDRMRSFPQHYEDEAEY